MSWRRNHDVEYVLHSQATDEAAQILTGKWKPMREDIRALNTIGAAALLLIGALSMTGIVVVVTEIPSDLPRPPEMELRSNETRDRVQVISTQEGLNWTGFDIKLRYTGGYSFGAEGEVVFGEHLVFTDIEREALVEPGDHFHVCRHGEGLPQVVTLRHESSLRLVGIWHFSEVVHCDDLAQGHEH